MMSSSPQSRDSIIQGLAECFDIEKKVVSAILSSQSWNMEKSLELLESISPKVNQKKKASPKPKKENVDGGKKDSTKARKGTDDKTKDSTKPKKGNDGGDKKKDSTTLKRGNDDHKKKDIVKPKKEKKDLKENDDKKKITIKGKSQTENKTGESKASSSGWTNNAPKSVTNKANNLQLLATPSIAMEHFKTDKSNEGSWTFVEMNKIPSYSVKTGQSTPKSENWRSWRSPALNEPEYQLKTSVQTVNNESRKNKRALQKNVFETVKLKSDTVDRIRDYIKFEIKLLILMRGCPGSGKSTYAKDILMLNGVTNPQYHIFSTDNYFYDSKGNYNYNKCNLDKAHTWNQGLVEKVMKIGLSPIIIDNTHIKAWEMMCYAQYAVRLGYVLETLEPPTPWFFNESLLAKKNSHNVSKDKISLMIDNYDSNLTGDALLKKFNIDYTQQQSPPQSVSYPLDQIINVMNKALAGKSVPSFHFTNKKIPQNPTKSNLQPSPCESDFEIVKTTDLTQKNNPMMNKKNISLPQNSLKPQSQSQANDKDKYFGKDLKITKAVENISSVLSSFTSSFDSSMKNKPASSDSNLNSKQINVPTEVCEEVTETYQSNHSSWRSSRPVAEIASVTLNPSDFPSLTSHVSNSCNNNSSNDFTKSLIHEQKTKQIIELFPHLDKEYISNLCSEPSKNVDDIVDILLEKAPNASSECLVKSMEVDTKVGGSPVASSTSDEDDSPQRIEVEKDVSMLIQLFPNKKELKIRETYEKCGYDLKISLEWLLQDGSSDEESEDENSVSSGSTDSQNAGDDKEDETDPLPSTFSFVENFKTFQKNSIEHETDNSKNFDLDVEDLSSCSEYSFLSDIKQNQSSGIDPINKTDAKVNVFKLHSKAYDKELNQAIDMDSTSQYSNLQRGEAEPDSSFVEPNEKSSVISSSANGLKNSKKKADISLDYLANELESVLSVLQDKSETLSAGPEDADRSDDNLDFKDNTKKSGLLSKLTNWNMENIESSKLIEKSIDISSPKEQRDKSQMQLSASTNTNYKDFENLKKAQLDDALPFKVFIGTGNFISGYKSAEQVNIPKFKSTLDKSTNTEEVEMSYTASGEGSKALSAMFPTLPLSGLDSLLEECVGDINWAVGLLLDSGLEISPDFNPSEHNLTFSKFSELSSHEGEGSPETNLPSTDTSQPIKSKKRNTQRIPVENINYVMSDESISKHVRKIRNARLGIPDSPKDSASEHHLELIPGAVEGSSEEEEEDEEEEETLDVALSTDFILALQAQFGGFIPNILPGQQALVTLPVYLARQLHSCIMDSLSRQLQEEQKLIDKMIQEDEWLARQLQEMENGESGVQHQSIEDIMDEELALNIHKSINKGKDKVTMASRLSCQLLIERFPTMDPQALKSLLEDTNHSLDQATKLLEAAGYQSANPASHMKATPKPSLDIEAEALSREEAVEQAGLYREAAKISFQMRHDCFQKAQRAYADGNKHVASYYSQMANWHNQKIEQANLLASTMLLTGNTQLTTLDLHFLRVCEAMQVLDLFIDAHVTNLIEIKMRKRQAYIITGRGLHSHDGKSHIRPATIARLKKRSIWYQLVNPGLLMVELTHKTLLTYQK